MKIVFAGALLACAPLVLWCQPEMPAWLAVYPGATPQISSFPALIEAAYTTAASPDAVQDYYRKLFASHNLPFGANEDGIGVVVRAAAECDLMLTIRSSGSGSAVRVSCAQSSPPSSGDERVVSARTVPAHAPEMSAAQRQQYDENVAKAMEMHREKAAAMGLTNKTYQDQPAPPLVWPKWLVGIQGAEIEPVRGATPAGNATLASRYITGFPMTALATLYRNLLSSHGYSYRASLQTGQTMSGVQQNALGYVEGENYPDGTPGPWTGIRVSFSRMYLNDPITVTITFTTFAFHGRR